jgi:transposase-like protein
MHETEQTSREVSPMERDAVITALSQEGKSQRAIARQIGISQPAVQKRLKKLGLITPRMLLSPVVPPPSGDTLSAQTSSVGDNHPAVPSQLPEPSSAENSALAQLRRRVLQLPVSPQITRCAHCAALFRACLLDTHCCWGCYRHSVGATSAPRHSAECYRVAPANLPLRR